MNSMNRILSLLIFVLISYGTFSQTKSAPGSSVVKWHTIEEAEKLFNKSPRPIFIDTYTDWCGWCKKMDSETFTHPVIAELLNQKFYPVKFNAEARESINFLGQTFVNDGKSGRTHQLALALLQGQLSYPTVVFMTKENDKFAVAPVPGFMVAKEMEVLLNYFVDNTYKTRKWEDFQQSFVGKVQ